MNKAKLGKHLEWHGNRIRVVVRVPPSAYASVGRTKLRETLNTTDPLEAEREKVDVVKRLRRQIQDLQSGNLEPDLNERALLFRKAIEQEEASSSGDPDEPGAFAARLALDDTVDRIAQEHGPDVAQAFGAIAIGKKTPLTLLLDRWFAERADFSIGYREDIRRAVKQLQAWCIARRLSPTIEAITRRVAGSYRHEQFIEKNVDPVTANRHISALSSYWDWLERHYDVQFNPWHRQRLKLGKRREEAGDGKRPFTDDEARTLLNGLKDRREFEFSLFSALSGLRINEIGALRVRDCAEGKITIAKSKTPAGLRTIPAHGLLRPLIARRSHAKEPDAFLFEELPSQRAGSKRTREAPVTQAFTRERRRLGVDERGGEKQRQSNVDFHSWRRYFIRQAIEALLKGAQGYSFWTIADVVGHKADGATIEGMKLPLGMTMAHYPGRASLDAMAACVNAVRLPEGTRSAYGLQNGNAPPYPEESTAHSSGRSDSPSKVATHPQRQLSNPPAAVAGSGERRAKT